MKWLMNRRKVILFGGPFFAIFFMIPWIPWTRTGNPDWLVGFHLIVSLFFYDAVLSFVLSAQCGLFTELTTKHSGRVRVIIYMEIAGLIGSFIILPVDAISKSVSDFKTFQICTCVVALSSLFFFWYTGHFATDEIAQVQQNVEAEMKVNPSTISKEETEKAPDNAFMKALKDGWISSKGIFTNRNFWCVVCGNFFHIMRVTANSNFLAIYTEALVSFNGMLPVGTFGLSLYYTFCNFVPKLVVILCWPALKKFGAWNTLMVSAALTIVNAIVAYSIGRGTYISVLSFLLFESIFSQSIWPAVYNIFFPDVIDEDMKINKRSHPFSTTIFTLNALITKPANSLAPIIIVAVLNNYGYNIFQGYRKELKNNYLDSTVTQMTPNDVDALMSSMFGVVCWFPAICAILEMLCFIPYRMKFKHKRNEDEECETNEGIKTEDTNNTEGVEEYKL